MSLYLGNTKIPGVKVAKVNLGGVELPELTNPATAEDIVSGKEVIDANGNKVTGEVKEVTEFTTEGFECIGWEPTGGDIPLIVGISQGDVLLRSNAPVAMTLPSNMLGDASPKDVAAGKMFSSNAGFEQIGTHVCPTVADLTADADATAGDISKGKTAWVKGEKLTGTKEDSGSSLPATIPCTCSANLLVTTSIQDYTGNFKNGSLFQVQPGTILLISATAKSSTKYPTCTSSTTGVSINSYVLPQSTKRLFVLTIPEDATSVDIAIGSASNSAGDSTTIK